ncbi:unnamed protein product [Brassica rapa]|uniref:Uncharacterized protein n=1 Tax=Brassica campestris TaxID=3711 RepID=A0A8D9HKA5_BRACM|nr:unnamed protein product [Brassica rapa]
MASKTENVSHNSGKKLASTIVTPSRSTLPNDANVTVRSHDAARTITFSPMEKTKQQFPKGDDLIMDALQDIDIAGSQDMRMDFDNHEDDLLGEYLEAME